MDSNVVVLPRRDAIIECPCHGRKLRIPGHAIPGIGRSLNVRCPVTRIPFNWKPHSAGKTDAMVQRNNAAPMASAVTIHRSIVNLDFTCGRTGEPWVQTMCKTSAQEKYTPMGRSLRIGAREATQQMLMALEERAAYHVETKFDEDFPWGMFLLNGVTCAWCGYDLKGSTRFYFCTFCKQWVCGVKAERKADGESYVVCHDYCPSGGIELRLFASEIKAHGDEMRVYTRG